MSKHHLLETEVQNILKVWNENCKHNQIDKHFSVTVGTRDRKVKQITPQGDLYECKIYIAELVLRCNERVIHRIEYPMGEKVSVRPNETQWKNELFRNFFYECIGTYCVTNNKMIEDHQLAEYDIVNDRLKANEVYAGTWIEIDKVDETSWYKVGQKFEVFTQTFMNNWGVYSYRTDHRNGIGQVPLIHAKIIKGNKTNKEDDTLREDINNLRKDVKASKTDKAIAQGIEKRAAKKASNKK